MSRNFLAKHHQVSEQNLMDKANVSGPVAGTINLTIGDPDMVTDQRIIRDANPEQVKRVVVNSPETREKVLEVIGDHIPEFKNKILLCQSTNPHQSSRQDTGCNENRTPLFPVDGTPFKP